MSRQQFLETFLIVTALALVPSASAEALEQDDPASLIEALKAASSPDRPVLLRKLVALGPGALEVTRAARDQSEDAEFRGLLSKAVHWQLAAKILPVLQAGVETQLTFDGQYTSLNQYGREGIESLLAVVDDSATDINLRIAACRALADIGDPSVLPRLRTLQGDILLPAGLREETGILLAVFGDHYTIEKDLREYERLSRKERNDIRLLAFLQLSGLYYRIRNYKKAVDSFEEIIEIFADAVEHEKKRRPPQRELIERLTEGLVLHYYNAACSNALYGDIDRCKKYLRKAVRGEPAHYENIEKDGDLDKLRSHPTYKEFRKELGSLFEGQDL